MYGQKETYVKFSGAEENAAEEENVVGRDAETKWGNPWTFPNRGVCSSGWAAPTRFH